MCKLGLFAVSKMGYHFDAHDKKNWGIEDFSLGYFFGPENLVVQKFNCMLSFVCQRPQETLCMDSLVAICL